MTANILLTGSTGFIGSHLLEKLISENYCIHCLVRKNSNFRWIREIKDKIILKEGNFLYPETLKNVMDDIDIVIHVAGVVHSIDWHNYYLFNFVGTKNILQAALKSKKVKKFFYFSSQSAYGPLPRGEIRKEDLKPNPVSHAGKSKLLSEEEVLKHKDDIQVTILRPTIVYGPRDLYLLPFFKYAKKGFFISFGSLNRNINLCYIYDLVEMVSLLLKKDIQSGEAFYLGGQNYPIYEIRDVLAKVVNKKLKNITIPDKILPLIGFFSEGIGKVFKRNNLLNLDSVKELTQENWAVSTEKISNFLGFLPYTPLKEGLKQTYEWYCKYYYL